MKKYVNGKYVELTAEEIAKCEAIRKQEEEKEKNLPPTEIDRIEALESALLELAEVMCNG